MPSRRARIAILSATGFMFVFAAAGFQTRAGAVPDANSTTRPSDDYRARFAALEATLQVKGVDACTNCHGGGMSRKRKRDGQPQKEALQWNDGGAGNHAVGFLTLKDNPRSRRMAALLGGQKDPTQREDCLACHALPAPPEQRGGSFALLDGVGCEACHGRSQKWLGSHDAAAWHGKSTADWLADGMYDLREPLRIAQKCSECHVGSGGHRAVTHAMMGAGHPDLTLELVSDLEHVPRHWGDGYSARAAEGSWYYARLWAVGQAVTLHESMQRLLRWVQSDQPAPDFALFDCFACHHEFLREPPFKDPNVPLLDGVTPGEPPWNAAPWAVCRSLVKIVSPDDYARGEAAVARLLRALRLTQPDRDGVRAAAAELAAIADELAAKVNSRTFDRDATRALLAAIVADYVYHLRVGPRGAEQGFAAVDALYRRAWSASTDKPSNDAALLDAIKALRAQMFAPKGGTSAEESGAISMLRGEAGGRAGPQLEPRSFAFDPAGYSAAMRTIAELLGTE